MKRLIIVFTLVLLVFTQSCRHGKADGTESAPVSLPEAGAADYGTEWAYAPLDSQIPADDPDFSVTGRGFEYRDGYLGAGGDGYFDLAALYEPGQDESFTFAFSYYPADAGTLLLGFWLYGADSVYGDGMPGEWIRLGSGYIEYEGKKYVFTPDGAAAVRLAVTKDGFAVYVDGSELLRASAAPKNGGGAVKVVSEKTPVYITNTAFRLGI